MKLISALLILFPLRLCAQFAPVSEAVYEREPLRMFGTNLYDLTPVIRAGLANKSPRGPCKIQGYVTDIKTNGVFINQYIGTKLYADEVTAEWVVQGDGNARRAALLARQVNGHYKDEVSEQWPVNETLINAVQWHFLHEQKIYSPVFVADVPARFQKKGVEFTLFALPKAGGGFLYGVPYIHTNSVRIARYFPVDAKGGISRVDPIYAKTNLIHNTP